MTDVDEAQATEQFRRTGERRLEAAALDEAAERRKNDRRVRKPGLSGLINTLLGKR